MPAAACSRAAVDPALFSSELLLPASSAAISAFKRAMRSCRSPTRARQYTSSRFSLAFAGDPESAVGLTVSLGAPLPDSALAPLDEAVDPAGTTAGCTGAGL